MRRFLVVVLAFTLMAGVLDAQIVDTGTINGVIQDPSGAVIPKVTVKLLDTDTGIETTSITDDGGRYASGPLHVGNYEIQAELSGYQRSVTQIRLDVAQHATVNVTLVIGEATQTVTVTDTAPMVGTETITLSNLQPQDSIKNLPLNSRNFSQLMSLGAGVMPSQSQLTGNLPIVETRGPTAYAVNGSRFEENHFLLDGISDNDNHNGYGIIIYPPLDAVEEFRQENSVADARYGRGGGGTVNLIYKSGTKDFHGDLFEFLRNSDFDAKNYFDKVLPEFRMNQFGGSVGGPVFWRHKGNPKTFFFLDYQGTRTRQGLTYISTVPTAAFRTGDFSGSTSTIYDPLTTTMLPGGTYTRASFSGNKIPSTRFDPVGQALLNLYPLPNLPGTANNYLLNPVLSETEDKGDLKIDHTFSAVDNGYVRYSHARNDIFTPSPFPAPAVGNGSGPTGTTKEPSNQLVLSETHLFSPRAINETRVGFSRESVRTFNIDYGQDTALNLGISGSNVVGNPLTSGLPLVNVSGATAIGESGLNPAVLVSEDYQEDDDVTMTWGRHTITVGGEALRLHYNAFQTGNERGTFTFTTQYTQALTGSSTGTGLGFADLLLGKPASGSLAFVSGTLGFRQTDLAFYGQDSYHLTSKLNLILGVRYENYLGYPWTEVENRMYQFVPALNTVEQVGTHGLSRTGTRSNNLNFMPRFGFAYNPFTKTVLRGGYGIFFSGPPLPIGVYLGSNPPQIISTAFTNNQFDFPGAQAASAGFSRSSSILGAILNAVDPNLSLPYTQQWNLAIEHQITPSTLVTIAYVGTKGTHLNAYANINQPVPGTTTIASRRPYPLYSTISESTDVDPSSYNALQVTGERRIANGLSFHLAYTYSHSMDRDSGNLQGYQNNYDRRADWGDSATDVPSHFAASFSYVLPFRVRGAALRQLVEGWEFNGIVSLFDGLPFTVGSNTNTLNTGGASRAQLIGPGNGSLPTSQRTIQKWFNTAAFTAPGPQQYGNVRRDTLEGPGTKEADLSFFKDFMVRSDDVRRLQFRAEAFNVTNTPQFNNPNGSIGSAGVGTITSAGAPFQFQRLSREIQLGLKLYF